ncbi:hypothetical protein BVC80_857g16 [Macleaya cordata]|uniref:Morc S5 domain-containing protein n=1 Tax=Macleaya cordata TaxID=56857 RepID=A0A200Q6P9_MACCD|nr:hypothetical protein BVC80_857g16 [Macleaya cordata]
MKLQKPDKNPVNVVHLESSDEEEDGNGRRTRKRNHSKSSVEQQQQQALHSVVFFAEVSGGSGPLSLMASSNHQYQKFESLSFWRAGDYDVGSTKSAPPQGQLEHARVHPKFLHSNATSHKWAFGAIAELLDNAVDEISNGATFVKVDKIYNMRNNSPALLFQDNGGGMDPDCMRQCMSLGYSSKKTNTTIGQYGNGFKTSTMRLGADVIVFSRTARGSRVTQSIGLLSYTFLRRTGQDDVIVPMVDFEISGNQTRPIIYSSQDDWSSNLKLILEWSPFVSKDELMQQFDAIGVRGTKVIIYNLWLNDDGVLELDFNNDEEDICLRDEVKSGILSKEHESHDILLESHVSYRLRFSLRAYVSILYLRKFSNFHIILRGKPVQQYIIAENLILSEVVMYRPKLGMTSKEVSVETTIGLVKEAPCLGVSGFNVYHKNRLIRPFWKVTLEGSSRGRCIVAVLEANFIEPAHDKQDFERSALFIRLEAWLKQLMLKYWTHNRHLTRLFSRIPEIHNMQKEFSDHQPTTRGAGLPKEWPTEQHDIGFSANSEEEIHLDQPVIGLAAANMQQGFGNGLPIVGLAANSQNELGSVQTIIGLAAVNMQHGFGNGPPIVGLAANSQKELGTVQSIIGLAAGSFRNGASLEKGSSSSLIDQICEENIELFMRCDTHRQKEIDLKNTIEGLQKELEEAKRRCSQLSSHVESQKKQMLMKHETGKT